MKLLILASFYLINIKSPDVILCILFNQDSLFLIVLTDLLIHSAIYLTLIRRTSDHSMHMRSFLVSLLDVHPPFRQIKNGHQPVPLKGVDQCPQALRLGLIKLYL